MLELTEGCFPVSKVLFTFHFNHKYSTVQLKLVVKTKFLFISHTCFTQIPLRGFFVKQFSLIFPLFPWCGGNWFHSLWILFHNWGNTIHQFFPQFPQNFPRIPPKFTNFPPISPEFPPTFPRNSQIFPEFPQTFPQFPPISQWFLLILQFLVQFSLHKCSLLSEH